MLPRYEPLETESRPIFQFKIAASLRLYTRRDFASPFTQVGHRSLKTTSVYLSPSTEKMAEAYNRVNRQ